MLIFTIFVKIIDIQGWMIKPPLELPNRIGFENDSVA